MTTRKEAIVKREEELRLLNAQAKKIREDRAYGIKLAQEAGILDENGQLTSHYKPNED